MDAEMDAEQVTQGQPDETLHDVLQKMEELVKCGHVSERAHVELSNSLALVHSILVTLKKIDKRNMDTIKFEEKNRKVLEKINNFYSEAYENEKKAGIRVVKNLRERNELLLNDALSRMTEQKHARKSLNASAKTPRTRRTIVEEARNYAVLTQPLPNADELIEVKMTRGEMQELVQALLRFRAV